MVNRRTGIAKGANCDVCFTPESGHVQCTSSCPLWAISGHSFMARHAVRSKKDVDSVPR
jgi:hypothetical protein